MPHRQERAVAVASATNASVYNKHMADASNVSRGTTPADILRPNSESSLSSAGVFNTTAPWIHTNSVHRVAGPPSLETRRSSDSTDRSTSTKTDEETVATLATEAASDELEKREATASALLNLQSEQPSSPSESSAVPLKKRKKHLDFLRRNTAPTTVTEEGQEPCHVSPGSNSSIGANGPTVSSDENTPKRPTRVVTTGAQRSNSYDSKESPYRDESTQALLNSSKIHRTAEISPPDTVVLPHFPSVLHQVLSDPEYAGTVMKWLPDGEGWKVLRWDALRRQILPRYFADLRDENGKGAGTIDAFLWHLMAWGFEEIKDGTDVGAYRHDVSKDLEFLKVGYIFVHLTDYFEFLFTQLFIRGAQKLCSKMRLKEQNESGPKTVSPPRLADRTLLQVPSLNSTNAISSLPPNKRPRYDEQSSIGLSRKTSSGPLNWPMRPQEPPKMMEPYNDAMGWGHYYKDSNFGQRHIAGQYPGSTYDSRYFHHASAETVRRPSTYSPPQIRSGRGASKVSTASRILSASSNTSVRSSFPVSNRGKGSRRPSVCRSSIQKVDSSVGARRSPVGKTPISLSEAHRIGSAVQGVAIAISRKTKMKLPLARKTETAPKKASAGGS